MFFDMASLQVLATCDIARQDGFVDLITTLSSFLSEGVGLRYPTCCGRKRSESLTEHQALNHGVLTVRVGVLEAGGHGMFASSDFHRIRVFMCALIKTVLANAGQMAT